MIREFTPSFSDCIRKNSRWTVEQKEYAKMTILALFDDCWSKVYAKDPLINDEDNATVLEMADDTIKGRYPDLFEFDDSKYQQEEREITQVLGARKRKLESTIKKIRAREQKNRIKHDRVISNNKVLKLMRSIFPEYAMERERLFAFHTNTMDKYLIKIAKEEKAKAALRRAKINRKAEAKRAKYNGLIQ